MGQCPKCGATANPDHTFCLTCGAELAAATQQPSPTAPTEPPPPVRAPTSPARTQPPAASGRGREAAKTRRPQRSGGESALPPLVALVLSLGLQQLINSTVPADAYIYRLFRPEGGWVMSVVPALIAFVFIWTITDLILKLRVARVNEFDLARPEVGQVANLVRQEPTSAVLQRLRGWDAAALTRPVGRRVLWLLQHLDTVDSQRAHELTRHQSDLESDSAASGYRTVRLFIWAMPILGFIGTVLGISLAVGSFSEFLTTNVSIDEIDRVTAELGNVASGLSFAFDTTLLGLLAGLVANVASSGLQSKEERFLTGVEELSLRIMESADPTGASPGQAAPSGAAAGAEFDEMMRSRLQELSTQMHQFTGAVQSGLDGFLSEWGKLPPEVEKVATDLGGLREHLSSAAKSTDTLILETRLLLEGLNEASTHMGNRLTTSIGSISQTVDGLGSSLGDISGTLETSLSGLNERVQASESHLTGGLGSLKDAIESNRRDDAAAAAALEGLAATIAELGRTLTEFKEAQSAMVPLLSQLSGPLELRLMPTPTASPPQR
jgi:biopolymer transport protein ExbB/TolQ